MAIHDALDAGNAFDVALEPTDCRTRFQIPYGRRAITTACDYEAT
jgi:hypothetical protein